MLDILHGLFILNSSITEQEIPMSTQSDKGEQLQEKVKAKLFINGRSQAVRIPKELAFSGIDAVNVEKRGNAIILTPARLTWESFAQLKPAAEDFMVIRPRLVKS